MKTIRKTTRKLMFGGLMLCIMMLLAIPSVKSEAASKKPTCSKKQTVYMTKQENPYTNDAPYWSTRVSGAIYIKNLSSNAKITNIKSSNKKIQVKNMFNLPSDHATKFKGLWVEGNGCKPGAKSKISFKVKQNGRTYSLSCTVTLKKETARFKSLKIGGKNYASQLAGYESKNLKLSKKKTKLTIKMKSGMKQTGITILTKSGTKEIKNGASVRLHKGDQIFIDYRYTKKPRNYSSCLGKASKDFYLYGSTTIYVK